MGAMRADVVACLGMQVQLFCEMVARHNPTPRHQPPTLAASSPQQPPGPLFQIVADRCRQAPTTNCIRCTHT